MLQKFFDFLSDCSLQELIGPKDILHHKQQLKKIQNINCMSLLILLVLTKRYGVRATMIQVQMLLLQRCASSKFHVIDGQDYEWQKVQTQVIKLHSVHSIHS